MRKVISTVLSVAVMLTSFTMLIGNVISATSGDTLDFTRVSFDGKSADYYIPGKQTNATYADSKDANHGKAVRFNIFSSYWTSKWPQALRVGATDGSGPFMLEKGAKYKLSFDYRKSRVTADINLVGALVDVSNGIANLGTWGDLNTAGRSFYVGWIASGNSSKWQTYNTTFVAPCDGTMALAPITYDMSEIKYQQFWIDNIIMEKVVEYDGSKVEVTFDYNNGTEPTVESMYIGHSYGHPMRDGYIFDGWYVDSDCTVTAPTSVRKSCTKVYAKWLEDNRVAQETENTYDDSEMEFSKKEGEGDPVFYLNKKGDTIKNESTEFSRNGAGIDSTTFPDNNVLYFTHAGPYNWQWPTIATIYDNSKKTARFLPNTGSVYEISLKYRVDKAADKKLFLQVLCVSSGIANPNGAYNAKNVYVNSLAEITDVTDGWVEAKAVFTTASAGSLCLTLVNESTGWADSVSDIEVYVDDVKVKERLDTYGIYFETNGGASKDPVKCLAGEEFPIFDTPVREGYCFTGWYTDANCTEAISSTVMPNKNITLYAGWTPLEGLPDSLDTGFEEDEYSKAVYTNDGTKDPVNDNSMTASALWHRDDSTEAYEGNGYIIFDDGDTVLTDSKSNKFMAVSLYNPDGTPFCVTKDKRYKISLAYRHSGSTTNQNAQFMFLITNQSPGIGINYGNSTVLYEAGTIGPDKHETQTWGEFSTYVVANETGAVKLAMYGSTADQKLEVDNVKIKLMSESECVRVEYIQQDQNQESRHTSGVRYGAPGDLLIAGQSSHIDGYAFDGWRTKDGELYSSNRFPSSDLTLYASWRVADNAGDAAPNPKEEVLLDFEDTDKAKAFYEDSANNYHPENGVFLTVNDPDNAHSGNNYFQFYQCGHWMDDYLRRFKLYDPDTAGNQVYLEPNSVYKVSFWLNIESVGAGNLYLCTFPDRNSMTEYDIQNENYITDTNSFENFDKWVLYENTVITGDDEDGDGIAATLGFTFYGGYLTAKLDDISIVKLKEVTVSFESNGGSDVNDLTQLSYDYAIAPADPEREGYTFTGWYTDEKLTQPFDFKTALITKDIKLYAGWKVAEKDTSGSQNATNEKEPIYNTVTEYEKVEQTVDVEVPDKELDEQLTFADTDKVGKINKQNTSADASEGSSNLVWIIIAIAGGVVLVAAAAVVTVIAVKKRKRRN